jgi:hypothetical protein
MDFARPVHAAAGFGAPAPHLFANDRRLVSTSKIGSLVHTEQSSTWNSQVEDALVRPLASSHLTKYFNAMRNLGEETASIRRK